MRNKQTKRRTLKLFDRPSPEGGVGENQVSGAPLGQALYIPGNLLIEILYSFKSCLHYLL